MSDYTIYTSRNEPSRLWLGDQFVSLLLLEGESRSREPIFAREKHNSLIADLGSVYMEKSCPGQEGHPPSLVNFTKCLYEKKVDPSARAKS